MNPIVVHVIRPFANEAEYLAIEAWTIQPRGMLLVAAPPLAAGTPVLFDIALADGQKVIRAEGRVLDANGASGLEGLRVRFKRFGAATKAFIERAIAVHQPGDPDLGPELIGAPPSQPLRARPSLAPPSIAPTSARRPSRTPSAPPASGKARTPSVPAPSGTVRSASAVPPAAKRAASTAPAAKRTASTAPAAKRTASTPPGADVSARKGPSDEPRTRKASLVTAPQNRDELLARLRRRRRHAG